MTQKMVTKIIGWDFGKSALHGYEIVPARKKADGYSAAECYRSKKDTESSSVLWASKDATLLDDILFILSFFSRKLICREKEYGKDEFFYRPPSDKALKFKSPLKHTENAVQNILAWSQQDVTERQENILAFHYLMSARVQHFLHAKIITLDICYDLLKSKATHSLKRQMFFELFGIKNEQFKFVEQCLRRLRNTCGHQYSIEYTNYLSNKDDCGLNKIKFKRLIKGRDFNKFCRNYSPWAYDAFLSLYFAKFFGVFNNRDVNGLIKDHDFMRLKGYFKKLKARAYYPIYKGPSR